MINSSTMGQIAGILAFISFLPYIRSILRKETKPQRTTYTIWTVVTFVTLFSYFASGARDTMWQVLVFAAMQLIVLGLSFKYGMGGFEKLDIFCFAGAALGVILWIITNDPRIALYLSIIVEGFGWMPTIKKTYNLPYTENVTSWAIACIASVCNLLAITAFSPEIISYPLFVFVFQSSLLAIILIRRRKVEPFPSS